MLRSTLRRVVPSAWLLAASCVPFIAHAQRGAARDPSLSPPVLSEIQASWLRSVLGGEYEVACFVNVYDPTAGGMGAPPTGMRIGIPGAPPPSTRLFPQLPATQLQLRELFDLRAGIFNTARDLSGPALPIVGSPTTGVVLRGVFLDDQRWRQVITWGGVKTRRPAYVGTEGVTVLPLGGDGLLSLPIAQFVPKGGVEDATIADSIMYTRPIRGKTNWGMAVTHHEIVVWPVLVGDSTIELRGEYRTLNYTSHTFQYADTTRGEITLRRVGSGPVELRPAQDKAFRLRLRAALQRQPWLRQMLTRPGPPAFLRYQAVSGAYVKRDGGVASGVQPPFLATDSTGARAIILCRNMGGKQCGTPPSAPEDAQTVYATGDYLGRATPVVGPVPVCLLRSVTTGACLKKGTAATVSVKPARSGSVARGEEESSDDAADDDTTAPPNAVAAVDATLLELWQRRATESALATMCQRNPKIIRAICVGSNIGIESGERDALILTYLDSAATAICARRTDAPSCTSASAQADPALQAVRAAVQDARCEVAAASGKFCESSDGGMEADDSAVRTPRAAPVRAVAPAPVVWVKNPKPYAPTQCAAKWFPKSLAAWKPDVEAATVLPTAGGLSVTANSLRGVTGRLRDLPPEQMETMQAWWSSHCGSAPFPKRAPMAGLTCADSAVVRTPRAKAAKKPVVPDWLKP